MSENQMLRAVVYRQTLQLLTQENMKVLAKTTFRSDQSFLNLKIQTKKFSPDVGKLIL